MWCENINTLFIRFYSSSDFKIILGFIDWNKFNDQQLFQNPNEEDENELETTKADSTIHNNLSYANK